MGRKEEIRKELEDIERAERDEQVRKSKEKNYKLFKNRIDDAIIGKAHITINQGKKLIGNTISIHGNCGTSYSPNAVIIETTHTYFHNMWSDEDERKFQEKLNKVAMDEVNRIMNKLNIKLDLIGLQSPEYYLQKYPEEYHEEILNEYKHEISKTLEPYSDNEFINLIKDERNWVDEDNIPIPPFYEPKLSHSRKILYEYIQTYRPHLIEEFKKCKSWNKIME